MRVAQRLAGMPGRDHRELVRSASLIVNYLTPPRKLSHCPAVSRAVR